MNRFAKLFSFAAIWLVMAAASSAAQDPLVLTDTVTGIHTFCYKDKPPMAAISLLLQFRNDGNEPLIVLTPNLLFDDYVNFGTATTETTHGQIKSLTFNPYLSDDPFRTATTKEDIDHRWSLFRKLKESSPPVLEPGAYREFRYQLLLTSGFKFDQKIVIKPPSECPGAPPPIAEHQYFSLELRLPSKREPSGDVDIFKKLADRWKKDGRLVLDDSGDVVYRSQRIIL